MAKYDLNVAPLKTKWQPIACTGQRGGKCPRPCVECVASKQGLCRGCDIECPDQQCPGTQCFRCPFLCSRGGERLETALDFIGGLETENKKTIDEKWGLPVKFIPAYNKRLPVDFVYPVVSIPFYAIYDFEKENIISVDVRDLLRVPDETRVIVNFYMKDDKIIRLFDFMLDGSFRSLIRQFGGVDFWHTPCFSVFSHSSNMDRLLNFKRQFWIGDIMRDGGLDVFQEVLYTTRARGLIKATPVEALELIIKKGIKKISQCGQIDFDGAQTLKNEMPFIRALPADVTWFITGLNSKLQDAYNSLRRNMLFANYAAEYRFKKNFAEYVVTRNNDLERR